MMIGAMLLMLPLAADPGEARDPDGRYANSPLKQWFDSLKSGKGPCCSDADGSAVSDVDWESKGGHYRVRIDGEWHDVPEDAVITEPNRVGPNHGLADSRLSGIEHPLLHAGQHDVALPFARARVRATVILREGVQTARRLSFLWSLNTDRPAMRNSAQAGDDSRDRQRVRRISCRARAVRSKCPAARG